jgi:predicted acylesterase/phospholipase RssA
MKGLYHLGVVKTLLEHKLLPRIVCGSSIGALIAALVCIHTDEELPVSDTLLLTIASIPAWWNRSEGFC